MQNPSMETGLMIPVRICLRTRLGVRVQASTRVPVYMRMNGPNVCVLFDYYCSSMSGLIVVSYVVLFIYDMGVLRQSIRDSLA